MSCPECSADEGHFAICSHNQGRKDHGISGDNDSSVRTRTLLDLPESQVSSVGGCIICGVTQGYPHQISCPRWIPLPCADNPVFGTGHPSGTISQERHIFLKGDLYCPHCLARPEKPHSANCGKYAGNVRLWQCATYLDERNSIPPTATAFLVDSREPFFPNPKDLVGDDKLPLHLWPPSATAYGCLGMLEGKLKYGLVNYRGSKVIASIYVAAAKRHLDEWYEGLDYTDEGNPSLGNALATIAIIVDAIVNESLIDDRPYTPIRGAYHKMRVELTKQVKHLKELFAEKRPKHWTNK